MVASCIKDVTLLLKKERILTKVSLRYFCHVFINNANHFYKHLIILQSTFKYNSFIVIVVFKSLFLIIDLHDNKGTKSVSNSDLYFSFRF